MEITIWMVTSRSKWRMVIHGIYSNEKEAQKCLEYHENQFDMSMLNVKVEIQSFIIQDKFIGE